MKKILVNATIYNSPNNGLGVYTLQVLKVLENLQGKTAVFKVVAFTKIDTSIPVRVLKYTIFHKLFTLGSLSIYRIFWNMFCLHFKSNNYDLVYSVSPHGSLFLKNQIVTVHDLIGLDPNVKISQAIYYRTILKKLLRKAKIIISISNATKEELVKEYELPQVKIIVLYNGVDHYKIQSELSCPSYFKSDKPFFLVVGASYTHKNVGILIDTFVNMPDIVLIVVHNFSSYSRGLINKVEKRHQKNVIFLSKLTERNLAWLYTNARANIYISLKEGFGFPPFEALSYGTTSVVSKIKCFYDVYGRDSFIYVDPNDPKEIGRLIEELQNNKINIKDSINNARERMKKYTWKEFQINLESILENA